MTAPFNQPPIFDGHNDLILRLLRGSATAEGVAAGLPDGHIDLPRARSGGLGGGFFAIFVASPSNASERHDAMVQPEYDLPLPEMITTLKRLKSSVVIPMHWFSTYSLQAFLAGMQDDFAIDMSKGSSVEVSLRDLPDRPTIVVLAPEWLEDAPD